MDATIPLEMPCCNKNGVPVSFSFRFRFHGDVNSREICVVRL